MKWKTKRENCEAGEEKERLKNEIKGSKDLVTQFEDQLALLTQTAAAPVDNKLHPGLRF